MQKIFRKKVVSILWFKFLNLENPNTFIKFPWGFNQSKLFAKE